MMFRYALTLIVLAATSVANSTEAKPIKSEVRSCGVTLDCFGRGEVQLPSGEWVKWSINHKFGIVVCASQEEFYSGNGAEGTTLPPSFTVSVADSGDVTMHYVGSVGNVTMTMLEWLQPNNHVYLLDLVVKIMEEKMALKTRNIGSSNYRECVSFMQR